VITRRSVKLAGKSPPARPPAGNSAGLEGAHQRQQHGLSGGITGSPQGALGRCKVGTSTRPTRSNWEGWLSA